MDNNYIQSELPLPVHNHFEVLPDDLFIPPNALEVCLESFSGPLDLLLYLIKKDDIHQKCINICKKNTLNLNISNRTKFFKSDIDKFNCGKYDLIVSNPPYINKLDLQYGV